MIFTDTMPGSTETTRYVRFKGCGPWFAGIERSEERSPKGPSKSIGQEER
jgi:hypothetical protein